MTGLCRGAITAEWIKLRSVQSTYVALAVAVVTGIGLGLLDTWSVAHAWATMPADQRASFDPVGDSLSGFQLGELAFGVLGVLAASSEYATGTITATLTAIPQRGAALAAKAVAVGALTLLGGQLLVLAAFLACRPVLATHGLSVGLGDPGVLRALGCAGLYLFVVAMLGLGLGALLRHTAAAVAALFALVFLGYAVARVVETWTYLPDHWVLANAADVLASTHVRADAPRLPTLAQAGLDLAAYLVTALGLGTWRWSRDP
jgi:ABC-2 type transport system permease protein